MKEKGMEEERKLVEIYPWIREVPPKLKPLLN
jgi:hypothetical protein